MIAHDEERLRGLVQQFDQLVPREGATVYLGQYGGGPDEGFFVANQNGYLRFGIEFLKAGVVDLEQGKTKKTNVQVALEGLVSEHSVIGFDALSGMTLSGPIKQTTAVDLVLWVSSS